MERLPDEILIDILDYLEPHDLISVQRVCRCLLKVARDTSLWRFKCFERAPSAAYAQASNPNALSVLTGALGGLSLGDSSSLPPNRSSSNNEVRTITRVHLNQRVKAVMNWDGTDSSERIDWYSEYIARHAPLSTEWLDNGSELSHEVRGMALFDDDRKIIGPLDDGSVCVWDIQRTSSGRRRFTEMFRSKSGLLCQTISNTKRMRTLGSASDCVTVDLNRMKAYIAVEDCLNEIDLNNMQISSQNSYAWPITALSQQCTGDFPLMVGTSWSLHMHDPRVPLKQLSLSVEETTRLDKERHGDPTVFLPNHDKSYSHKSRNSASPTQLTNYDQGDDQQPAGMRLEAFAKVEPGPQAILNRGPDEIIIAGRIPSILFYDKRFFPKLQHAIHSGARLSALATIGVPPRRASHISRGDATLVACGEYQGRGSLEIYELPHHQGAKRCSITNTQSSSDESGVGSGSASDTDLTRPSGDYRPYVYKNRQAASSAKLLSVAVQGTRIVVSDGEGSLKWMERDGRGLARRWNINSYHTTPHGAGISGEHVVRKLLPLQETDSARGTRGDTDLLVWTGEKLGIVTSKPKWEDHDDLIKAFEKKMNLNEEESEHKKAEEYSKVMRRALERQADERRWMGRFNLKR